MKRYNNLFEKIVSIDNLYLADKKARKNKSNRNDIKEFDKYKDSLLVRLQSTLINQTYTTSKYDTFIIREPKERLIFKLPYLLLILIVVLRREEFIKHYMIYKAHRSISLEPLLVLTKFNRVIATYLQCKRLLIIISNNFQSPCRF